MKIIPKYLLHRESSEYGPRSSVRIRHESGRQATQPDSSRADISGPSSRQGRRAAAAGGPVAGIGSHCRRAVVAGARTGQFGDSSSPVPVAGGRAPGQAHHHVVTWALPVVAAAAPSDRNGDNPRQAFKFSIFQVTSDSARFPRLLSCCKLRVCNLPKPRPPLTGLVR